MKHLFAYIRVSDQKQKEGASLAEQRNIIQAYADRIGAMIVAWFEETRTAAKAGRPVFSRMLAELRAGKAEGVIIHKLDRGTRNYRDWAEIDELIEGGIDVYVANDNLDLRSRGGRLAADVQIAVAVDYIRNLREEALKGIHGRLKQGILPNAAGIGYLDRGAGKPKEIDPKKGPLVRRLFELYATGGFTLRELTAEAERLGLRNKGGHPLRLKDIQKILRNPFYAGVIRSRRFGLFSGAHEPLVTRARFDRVQEILSGRFVRRARNHEFLFRRMVHCKTCGRSLIASERKGRAYYRCSTYECPTTSLREDAIDTALRAELAAVRLTTKETDLLSHEVAKYFSDEATVRAARQEAIKDALVAANARISRLTDLLLDGKIDSGAHDEKRNGLVMERLRLEQEVAAVEALNGDLEVTIRKIVELAQSAETLYEIADPLQKRQLFEIVMSNCIASGKTLEFSLREPFATFANRDSAEIGGQLYYTDDNFPIEALISWASQFGEELSDVLQPIKLAVDVRLPFPEPLI
jgi:DNA invertase Pin-like site-specific DNA recombinase